MQTLQMSVSYHADNTNESYFIIQKKTNIYIYTVLPNIEYKSNLYYFYHGLYIPWGIMEQLIMNIFF